MENGVTAYILKESSIKYILSNTLILLIIKKVKFLIKHIVMWKLKEFAEGRDKLENAKIIKLDLENLQNKINQIRYIEVGIDINKSEQAYDVVLYSEFNNIKDLNIYQNHSDHIRISEFISKVRDIRVVVDYEN